VKVNVEGLCMYLCIAWEKDSSCIPVIICFMEYIVVDQYPTVNMEPWLHNVLSYVLNGCAAKQ